MPGSNARVLDKARALPADVLILDLEDAVHPGAKAEARRLVRGELGRGGYGARELVVRVNGVRTPWGADDLEMAAASGADAVLVPKVESAEALREAADRLAAAGAPPQQALWAMIETPGGVLAAAEIAAAAPRLRCLVAGTSDLVKDLRARHTPLRLEVLVSLSLVVLAARARGLAALDGVHLDLADDAGFEASCRQGVDLGFDGKTLIHPRTIEAANRIFGPSPEAVARARRVIDAHEAALSRGEGVAVVEGRLVEALHVEEAERTVALVAAIEARGW